MEQGLVPDLSIGRPTKLFFDEHKRYQLLQRSKCRLAKCYHQTAYSQLRTWIFFSCFRASSFSLLAVSTWDSSDLRSPSIFLRALTAAERWRRSSSSSASSSRNYNTAVGTCRHQHVCNSMMRHTTVTSFTLTQSNIAFVQGFLVNLIPQAWDLHGDEK